MTKIVVTPRVRCRRFSLHSHGDTELHVEVAERLIEEQDVRLIDDRASHGHALLLSTGELVGKAMFRVRKGDECECAGDLSGDLVTAGTSFAQTVGDVFTDGEVGEQRVPLKHHSEIALPCRHGGDVTTADQNAAAIQLGQTRDAPQGRRLAATARAEERKEFAIANLKIIDVEDDLRAV